MTNEQALGYLLLACKEQGLSRAETEALYNSMRSSFDFISEEEADEQGYKWFSSLER